MPAGLLSSAMETILRLLPWELPTVNSITAAVRAVHLQRVSSALRS